jgi:amphi-Trp domain-containing protein
MGKQKVTVEGTVELAEAITYLTDIAAALGSGKVRLQQAGNEITLAAPMLLDLKIEARNKDGEQRLSIKLAWSDDPRHGVCSPVTISPAGEPAA